MPPVPGVQSKMSTEIIRDFTAEMKETLKDILQEIDGYIAEPENGSNIDTEWGREIIENRFRDIYDGLNEEVAVLAVQNYQTRLDVDAIWAEVSALDSSYAGEFSALREFMTKYKTAVFELSQMLDADRIAAGEGLSKAPQFFSREMELLWEDFEAEKAVFQEARMDAALDRAGITDETERAQIKEDIKSMADKGYSFEEQIALLHAAKSSDDFNALHALATGSYKEIFAQDPEAYSTGMQGQLYYYSYKLGMAGNYAELEIYVNAVIDFSGLEGSDTSSYNAVQKHKNRATKYLQLFAACAVSHADAEAYGLAAELSVGAITPEEAKEREKAWYRLAGIAALWHSLYDYSKRNKAYPTAPVTDADGNLVSADMNMGVAGFRISGLGDENANAYGLSFNLDGYFFAGPATVGSGPIVMYETGAKPAECEPLFDSWSIDMAQARKELLDADSVNNAAVFNFLLTLGGIAASAHPAAAVAYALFVAALAAGQADYEKVANQGGIILTTAMKQADIQYGAAAGNVVKGLAAVIGLVSKMQDPDDVKAQIYSDFTAKYLGGWSMGYDVDGKSQGAFNSYSLTPGGAYSILLLNSGGVVALFEGRHALNSSVPANMEAVRAARDKAEELCKEKTPDGELTPTQEWFLNGGDFPEDFSPEEYMEVLNDFNEAYGGEDDKFNVGQVYNAPLIGEQPPVQQEPVQQEQAEQEQAEQEQGGQAS